MKTLYRFVPIMILAIAMTALSCSTTTIKEGQQDFQDGRYDSEFPNKRCSKQLEAISESIKLINSIAYYRTTYFSEESKILRSELNSETIKKHGIRLEYMDNSASGTATVIFYNFKRVAVITCAHVVDFEDTLITYFKSPDKKQGYVQSIAIKERQANYIADFPEGGELDIIKIDRPLDIAVLGREYLHEPQEKISVFSYPLGEAKELGWGSFVYIFGYPMGYKTLTKALVSSPNRDKNGAFIIDAVFNRGFSGGIILAIKDGVPNFELVGMIKALFADYEYIIKPSRDFDLDQYNPIIPYSKELYVERRMNIKYGLSKAIPIESIKQYFIDNEAYFFSRGYDFNKFINENL
ncbi:MAG: S1 family peptidase [Ignavibacteriales bacterium]